jgi:hypothetical protein
LGPRRLFLQKGGTTTSGRSSDSVGDARDFREREGSAHETNEDSSDRAHSSPLALEFGGCGPATALASHGVPGLGCDASRRIPAELLSDPRDLPERLGDHAGSDRSAPRRVPGQLLSDPRYLAERMENHAEVKESQPSRMTWARAALTADWPDVVALFIEL